MVANVPLKKNEVIHDLLSYPDVKIIQRSDMFRFSLDTVLLARFATVSKDIHSAVDLGTNNGAIPLLLKDRPLRHITGVEILAEACDIAKRNMILNEMSDKVDIVCMDMREYARQNPKSTRLVLCNPPFFAARENPLHNETETMTIARHEVNITLEEIIQCAARLLEYHGRFAFVHRPDRLVEILSLLKDNDLEPKRLRFVYPKPGRDAHILLVEAVYKGNPGLKIEAPLFAHEQDGSYSREVRVMFGEKPDEQTEKL